MSGTTSYQIRSLIEVSARLGRNPLLTQAGSGNTSLKIDGVLWIKASGKWLANADREDILVPVDLAGLDSAGMRVDLGRFSEAAPRYSHSGGDRLVPSIETAMHAVIPWAATIHVHSVNTIVWAVQEDSADLLEQRLAGLAWAWIPYVPSGVPLAREVAKAFERSPETRILVLANHGLVVCGDDPFLAEGLLAEVEERLAIEPRRATKPDRSRLATVIRGTDWRLPDMESVHALSTDAISRPILMEGTLYPCQAIFLGPATPVMNEPFDLHSAIRRYEHREGIRPCYFLVGGAGVIVSPKLTAGERATLAGLTEIVQRIDVSANLRYLTPAELSDALTNESYRYRGLVEQGCVEQRSVEQGSFDSHIAV